MNQLAHGLLAGGARAGRAARVVRPELARGARHDPRGAQAATSSRCRSRTASTPKRWRTSSTTPTRPPWSSTPSRRRSSREVRDADAQGADRGRVRRRHARRAALVRGTTCSPGSPTTEPEIEPGSEAGAAMIYTSGTTGKPKGALRTRTDRADRVRAARRAQHACTTNAVHLTTGPLYHSGPLAFASLVAHARRADRRAAQVRRRRGGSDLVKEHRVTNTFSAPTQLKRIVSLPRRRAREGRHVVDDHA